VFHLPGVQHGYYNTMLEVWLNDNDGSIEDKVAKPAMKKKSNK
jgi:hypothetical protein